MTQRIETIAEIAGGYEAIVFDQWGVLHNGASPYPGAVQCLQDLPRPVAVLSNSGKRAAPNAERIADMGFTRSFEVVMTSGEALWRDIDRGHIPQSTFHAIERAPGDAEVWSDGLDISFEPMDRAEAVLLMGLPDGSALRDWSPVLARANAANLPVYCSNPDRKSPRADGYVISPGAVAFAYEKMGGDVTYYGKPHRPIFESLKDALGSERILMVGDSLEHDISGAAQAGWDSVFVGGGLYADAFADAPWQDALEGLNPAVPPTYFIGEVQ
ncbi:MAG: TIGR01459 family HAD-type hydrolase [Pseudomonadota bacterium]